MVHIQTIAVVLLFAICFGCEDTNKDRFQSLEERVAILESKEIGQEDKGREYERYVKKGNALFALREWGQALEQYENAHKCMGTGENQSSIQKCRWNIHMKAYEDHMAKKDFENALGEVTYGLMENHTSIEQMRKARTLEKELRALLLISDPEKLK